MSRETIERVKGEVEHLVAIGKITFAQGADRIEAAAKQAAKRELEHFRKTQAREVAKRPWIMPAAAVVIVLEALAIVALLAR